MQALSFCKECVCPADCDFCPELHDWIMEALDEKIELQAYKDTGLEPEEVTAVKHALMGKAIAEIEEFDGIPVSRLQELAQSDRNGRLVVLPPPANEGDQEPECYESGASIWCHGYRGFGCDDHSGHCKKCWYYEAYEEDAEAALRGGEG